MRDLAELPFVPPAILHNPELEWRALEERTVEVAAKAGGERLAVAIGFDDAGDIVRASSQLRRSKVGREWQATPWGGEFRAYATFGELRLPTAGEAFWELPEGRYVYWRGEIVGAEAS